MDRSTRESFEDHLMLLHRRLAFCVRRAPGSRRASIGGVVSNQNDLNDVRDAGREAFKVLQQGDLSAYGHMLTEQWKLKFARSPSAIHAQVDNWIAEGIAGGAAGGKLVGVRRGVASYSFSLGTNRHSARPCVTSAFQRSYGY